MLRLRPSVAVFIDAETGKEVYKTKYLPSYPQRMKIPAPIDYTSFKVVFEGEELKSVVEQKIYHCERMAIEKEDMVFYTCKIQ